MYIYIYIYSVYIYIYVCVIISMEYINCGNSIQGIWWVLTNSNGISFIVFDFFLRIYIYIYIYIVPKYGTCIIYIYPWTSRLYNICI